MSTFPCKTKVFFIYKKCKKYCGILNYEFKVVIIDIQKFHNNFISNT